MLSCDKNKNKVNKLKITIMSVISRMKTHKMTGNNLRNFLQTHRKSEKNF